ncbi:MAG: nucleotidyltransferase family protein [Massilia sp.]|jgi:hypothetical protein|nr:nucleotidyltransferase family protein [Massilia sp.]
MGDSVFGPRLEDMLRASTSFMSMLYVVRELNLESWCIGAGAVRSLVWDRLHNFSHPTNFHADVDVAYYDNSASLELDARLSRSLSDLMPSVRWEVTNQATVHHWFLAKFSQVVPPVNSLADGIATWPEYATCVGVSLDLNDSIEIIAPYGLDDLFSLRLRHNPSRASAEVFKERMESKRFIARWPLVSIVPV